MAFLVPIFLGGLGLLVVPLLVHLRHRERREPLRFPSLMFLRRVPFREVRRQRLHHWPLFLLRCLAVALLAIAFARPFLRDRDPLAAPASVTGRELVVLVDRSASMAYGGRWGRAQAAARDAVRALSSGDRATIVLFDETAQVAARGTSDQSLLAQAIASATPTHRGTQFGPALRAARDVLVASDRPDLEVVVISDFQRSGWRREALDPLPEATRFRPVPVGPAGPNVSLRGAEVHRGGAAGSAGGSAGPVISVSAVFNGADGPTAREVRLLVEGRQAASSRVIATGTGAERVTFPPFGPGDADRRVIVMLGAADSLAADDTLYLVVHPDRPLRVVIARAGGARADAAFLDRALELSRHPRMELRVVPGAPTAAQMRDADVVILDDVAFPTGAAGDALVAHLARGGGLVQVAGERSGGSWPPGAGGVRVGAVVDRVDAAGTIGVIRRSHPAFEAFRDAGTGDFSATQVYRYRRVDADSLDVLARYDDGTALLAEARVPAAGGGIALVLAAPLDNRWNDLPLQPVFLPFIHQLVLYASRHSEPRATFEVGETAVLGADWLGGQEAVVVVAPSGQRTRLTARADGAAGSVAVPLEEAGFHEVREARAGGGVVMLVAANVPSQESDLAAFDPADLQLAVGGRDTTARAADPEARALATAVEREQAQSLWWYFLIVVAVLLLGELGLANRLTGFVRTPTAAAQGGMR